MDAEKTAAKKTMTVSRAQGAARNLTERITGLYGSSRAWFIGELSRKHSSLTVICSDRKSAESLADELKFFASFTRTLLFPAWDTLPFEHVSPQSLVSAQRNTALSAADGGAPRIIVASVDALAQRVLPKQFLTKRAFSISSGQQTALEDLARNLERAGFLKVSLVEDVGEFSVKGLVVDFFPAGFKEPIRAEFLEDGSIALRSFDPDSQRSIGDIKDASVQPASEALNFDLLGQKEIGLAATETLKARCKELGAPPSETESILAGISGQAHIPGLELFQLGSLGALSTFFDYLPPDELLVVDNQIGAEQTTEELWELLRERSTRFEADHVYHPKPSDIFLSADELWSEIKKHPVKYLDAVQVHELGEEIAARQYHTFSLGELTTRIRSKVGSGSAFAPLIAAIEKWRRAGSSVAFVVGSSGRAERLSRLLLESNIDARIESAPAASWLASDKRYPVAILQGSIDSGFELPSEKLIFISEQEIFSERSYRQDKRSKARLSRLLSSLAQLKENDFVVHTDYGVGIYRGLIAKELDGATTDLIQIEYADTKLFLPVEHIGKVQKFVAAEGKKPVIDKLASTRWAKTKQKIRESVEALAGDLIKLYAERSVAKGWRFEPFGAEDERFADNFAYNETPDQWKAIEDTLKDMADDKPMDRLVCGDVGFGKTEVAIRAAFKCVQHARQAAVLVPTTVLVEQHKENFMKRFKGWPVEIAATSRFYSAKENKETFQKLASGEIDIIIGTHKLLSSSVVFRDLGLLIIDEEHRFGVKQKERLKRLKKEVDVLTLTATPIPRTLHMSLLGIRDISVINTAPQDRRTIRTYIAAHDETLIRDAILREIQRGGQVFFLHNRVQSISAVCAGLSSLVPEAKFAFAHGQMSEDELEAIMQKFIDKKIDVLVSTSIIESGLDIPNANTIIIDRADALGLAQLYQLRGRVGRSTRQAYAYLLVPKARTLSDDAQKRLQVLQSLDDLGLGFQLALRDMEIRGAGNLLGREQSGNVLAVGFDLYSKILKEAVLNLKGEEPDLSSSVDPDIKFGISAFIPDHYVPDVSERLVLYQRLAALDAPEEGFDLAAEIEDRYGTMPKETLNLIELMKIRSVLRKFGVERAENQNGRLVLAFHPRAKVSPGKAMALARKEPTKYRFSKGGAFSRTMSPGDFEDLPLLQREIAKTLSLLS